MLHQHIGVQLTAHHIIYPVKSSSYNLFLYRFLFLSIVIISVRIYMFVPFPEISIIHYSEYVYILNRFWKKLLKIEVQLWELCEPAPFLGAARSSPALVSADIQADVAEIKDPVKSRTLEYLWTYVPHRWSDSSPLACTDRVEVQDNVWWLSPCFGQRHTGGTPRVPDSTPRCFPIFSQGSSELVIAVVCNISFT